MGDEMKEERDEMQQRKVHNRKKRKEKLVKVLVIFQLVVFAVFFLFPFVWMLSVSLQTEAELMTTAGFLEQIIPKSWRFENYADVFRTLPFARYFANSGIVTLLTVFGLPVFAQIGDHIADAHHAAFQRPGYQLANGGLPLGIAGFYCLVKGWEALQGPGPVFLLDKLAVVAEDAV